LNQIEMFDLQLNLESRLVPHLPTPSRTVVWIPISGSKLRVDAIVRV
jgi:hypothetical protein